MVNNNNKEIYRSQEITYGLEPMVVPSEWTKSGSAIFVEGSGARIRTIDGKEYIDASACGMCDVVGYGNQEVAEAGKAQMVKLMHCLSFGGSATVPKIELAQKLAERTPGIKRFFFENSGSDAVEATIKAARWYWRQKGRDKYKIICRDRSYHGATFGAMAATRLPDMNNRDFEPLVPGFIEIPCPYCYQCPLEQSYPICDIACAQALEDKIKKEGEDTIAAFIAESLIGAGGFIVPPPEYWSRVREICDRYDVLLIMDEVITGFGRTGKFWAHQHWNVIPDLITSSKGITSGYIPMAAVGISEKVYRGLSSSDRPYPHLHTFTGHPVACAVSLKVIEIMERENLVEKAAKTGEYIRERLASLQNKSPYVGHVNGLGMLNAIELVADKGTRSPLVAKVPAPLQIASIMLKRGILFGSPSGLWRAEKPMPTVRMPVAPSVIISREDLDYLLDVLEEAVLGIEV